MGNESREAIIAGRQTGNPGIGALGSRAVEHRAHSGAHSGEYVYCPMCSARLERHVVAGTERPTCAGCGFVHWRNPGVGAAVLVFDDAGRVLLVRRGPGSTQPGLWCVPAGFVDYGEEVRAAAARELLEETGLTAEVGDVVHVASNFHDPAKLTVGIWFAGCVVGGRPAPGDDAAELGWFALDALPEMAFGTDVELLARILAERR